MEIIFNVGALVVEEARVLDNLNLSLLLKNRVYRQEKHHEVHEQRAACRCYKITIKEINLIFLAPFYYLFVTIINP